MKWSYHPFFITESNVYIDQVLLIVYGDEALMKNW